MDLKEDLKALISELNHIHSSDFDWKKYSGFPSFVTAANGAQRHFTTAAKNSLHRVVEHLHSNRPSNNVRVEIGNYEKIVQQVIADCHAEGEFDAFYETGEKSIIEKIRQLAEERLPSKGYEYTHYFSAWTVGVEKKTPFKLGPVTFWNRLAWVDSVDFPPNAKETYLENKEANHQWRDLLKNALQHRNKEVELDGLAAPIYDAIYNCPALLGVTISGYEKDLSRKLAKLVCRTALDSISLALGGAEYFHQQTLYEERLPPVGSASLLESNSYLWLPGLTLGKRIPHLSGDRVEEALRDMAPFLPAFASILNGLVDPENHTHPKLANRWATALDWYGEGNRESSDSIALAKLGTCLDVLACGGKNAGIADMVINITGTDGDTEVVKGDKPLTLRALVREIYETGRSRILHGTYSDRLQPFERERNRAAQLARHVLMESAMRLLQYSGDDGDTSFRSMPPVTR